MRLSNMSRRTLFFFSPEIASYMFPKFLLAVIDEQNWLHSLSSWPFFKPMAREYFDAVRERNLA